VVVVSQGWPDWAGGGPGTGSISIRSPGVGGAIAVGIVWALAITLIVIDGPLPVGDVAAAGLIGRYVFGNTWRGSLGRALVLVPDLMIFGLGETAVDIVFPGDTGTDVGMLSFNSMIEENMWLGPGVQFYVH